MRKTKKKDPLGTHKFWAHIGHHVAQLWYGIENDRSRSELELCVITPDSDALQPALRRIAKAANATEQQGVNWLRAKRRYEEARELHVAWAPRYEEAAP